MTAKLQDGYKNNAMHVNSKHKWCMKKKFGQKHRNWKFFSCNRSRIDWTSIESSRLKPKILIAISIDRKTGSIDRKFGKIKYLKKLSILMQKLLKAHCFIKKMHEYETKSFLKTLEFNPDLPKSRFSINLSSKRKHWTHSVLKSKNF